MDRAIIIGTNGIVLVTADGGASWTSSNMDTYVRISAVRALDAATAVVLGRILGESVVIERTSDGGATWTRVMTVPEASGIDALLSAGRSLYAFGYGTMLRSRDGGATWTSLTWGSASEIPGAFQCPQEDVCWLVSGGTLRRTLDGGDTWSNVTAPSYSTMAFLDATTGFMGSLGTQWTFDGAATWKWVGLATPPPPAWARSATEYWGWHCSGTGSSSACLLQSVRSDDGGLSWSLATAWTAPVGCSVAASSRLPESLMLDCGAGGWRLGRIDAN